MSSDCPRVWCCSWIVPVVSQTISARKQTFEGRREKTLCYMSWHPQAGYPVSITIERPFMSLTSLQVPVQSTWQGNECQESWSKLILVLASPDGRPYYYNPQTRVTQWEKPEELKAPQEVCKSGLFDYAHPSEVILTISVDRIYFSGRSEILSQCTDTGDEMGASTRDASTVTW